MPTKVLVVEDDINIAEPVSYTHLPATYVGQGSNYGFAGGLLGYTTESPELKDSLEEMVRRKIPIEFKTADIGRTHPNAAELFITGVDGSSVTALTHSTGGGMFEIVKVDGFDVSINGSAKKTLVFCSDGGEARKTIAGLPKVKYQTAEHSGEGVLFEITHEEALPAGVLESLSCLLYTSRCV